RDPPPHPLLWPRAEQGAVAEEAVADPRARARRSRAGGLRGARGASRRRAQDRERRPRAGIRAAGLPGRHAHPPARRALGPVVGTERRRDRAGPEAGLSRGRVGEAPPPDDLLRTEPLPRARPRRRGLPDLLVRRAPHAEATAGGEAPAATGRDTATRRARDRLSRRDGSSQ